MDSRLGELLHNAATDHHVEGYKMNLLKLLGDVLILAGLVVCAAPVITRLMGQYYVFGFELPTVLLGGVALLLMACVARLELLLRR